MSQVTDYNIANASGASVRADINLVLDAIKTCNAGGSDPTNPEAFMLYADTGDSNKLKIRNSSNGGFTDIGFVNEANLGLLLKSGGTMTGALLGDDASSASAPAFSFDQDPDTGMFRNGANVIGFATAGVERAILNADGLTLKDQEELRLSEGASNGTNYISLKSPASLSDNVSFTLPTDGAAGSFLQTNGSGVLSFSAVAGVPTGAVFCVAIASIPTGYLECNGAAVSRTTYAALFAFIGTQYGSGNGSSTFNLPDLRGEFIRGFDNGRGIDSGRSIGSLQTDLFKVHDHDADAAAVSDVTDPGHIHEMRGFGTDDDGGARIAGGNSNAVRDDAMIANQTGVTVSTDVTVDVDDEGGTETRPRNIAMMYIIKI
tara:strand:+ start:2162 stop:3283 length:1122 start_codon:yes stop_codon:yes gene_type:complete